MESSDYVSDQKLIDSVESLSRTFNRKYNVDRDTKEDLKQEIAVALLKARERFDHTKANWETFAFLKADYALREYFRDNQINNKEWKRAIHSSITYVPLETQLREPSVNETYENLYINEFLQICKTPKEKFIVLCLLAGFPQVEIERMLNQNAGALSKNIHRLRIVSSKYSSFLQTD